MTVKQILKELLYIAVPALSVAFIVNFLHPDGIAVFGQWDAKKGVITAKSKKDPVNYMNSAGHLNIEIDSLEAAEKIFNGKSAVFVDARPLEVYEEGHIKGAISIPEFIFDDLFFEFSKKYSPDTQIVTYCSGRQCQDSHKVANNLIDLGYTNVRIFIDGYPSWLKKGYPIETGVDKKVIK